MSYWEIFGFSQALDDMKCTGDPKYMKWTRERQIYNVVESGRTAESEAQTRFEKRAELAFSARTDSETARGFSVEISIT